MRTPFLLTAVLLSAAAAGTARAGDTARQVRALLDAATPAERSRRIDALVREQPDWREVCRALEKGRTYERDVPRGWVELTQFGSDAVERPYALYVPEDYDPSRRHRLLVHLHGGVSNPVCPDAGRLREYGGRFWVDDRTPGFLYAFPGAQRGAEWWTPAGRSLVLGLLRTLRRLYNIDENRVYLAGFSDGASGCFHMALADPSAFAGFLPLNGHPAVAQAGGLQLHLANLRNAALYMVSTGRDSLYPAARLKPLAEMMRKAGADLTFRVYEEMIHRPDYLPRERPRMVAWMEDHPRDPHPGRILWKTADPDLGRVHWLALRTAGEAGNDAPFPDYQIRLEPGRVLLGITIDPAFPGPGVRVDRVSDGSAARTMGLRSADVIERADEKEVRTLADLRAVLAAKDFGDPIVLRVRRDGASLTLRGRFPDPEPQPVFERGKPCSCLEARRKGNDVTVRARRTAVFDLYLSPAWFDFDRPLRLTVNGRPVFEGRVKPDLRFLLEQACRDEDRTRLYAARLPVVVEPAGGAAEEEF